LAASDWIGRAHLSHGVGHGQGHGANREPSPDHDRWASGLDADNEDTRKGCPAGDNAEGKSDHSYETETALEFCILLANLGLLLRVKKKDLIENWIAIPWVYPSCSSTASSLELSWNTFFTGSESDAIMGKEMSFTQEQRKKTIEESERT
jgi:hypothetical protein